MSNPTGPFFYVRINVLTDKSCTHDIVLCHVHERPVPYSTQIKERTEIHCVDEPMCRHMAELLVQCGWEDQGEIENNYL